MGGFFGWILDHLGQTTGYDVSLLEQINAVTAYRGPAHEGYYVDDFIHLAVRQLSNVEYKKGQQPLFFANNRYLIVFDGEIYNYKELKKQFIHEDIEFTTDSDTEIIVALYSKQKEKVVHYLRGMFAFIIWDMYEKTVFGARDPFGIKPIFYQVKENRFFFSSEKKSLLLLQQEPTLNIEALQHYLTFQYVPEPLTMHTAIKKLEPGHYFIKKVGSPMEIKQYWQPTFHPVHQSEDEFIKQIRDTVYESVKLHTSVDVPIGAFLSGGIDSTLIAAMARQIHPKIKTFSVGFAKEDYSEIQIAKETAAKLNIENISYTITAEEYMKEIPKIIWHLDDPLADPACVPLYFAAKLARKHVKVVLSGEGADELFGGYNIYREPKSLQIFNYMPQFLKRILKFIADIIPEGIKGKSFIERGVTPLEQRYIGNAKMFTEEEKAQFLHVYNKKIKFQDITAPVYQENQAYHPVERMQHIDIHTWLKGDILLKADRATMAHSLELRLPFLDQAVFNVAARVPSYFKTANVTTKYILRKASEGIIPDHVLNRKKLGFPVPIREWLKNEMYDWAKSIIHETDIHHLFDRSYIFQLLDDHCTGKADNSRKLWTILMFLVWFQVFVEKKYAFHQVKTHEKEFVGL